MDSDSPAKVKRRRLRFPQEPLTGRVVRLEDDATGVIEDGERPAIVYGALPRELVRYRVRKRHRGKHIGVVVEVLEAHPDRVGPGCTHYGLCSGCAMQHVAHEAQVRFKQDRLLACFRRHGDIVPEVVAPPLLGPLWGYRHKARLGVRYVAKMDKVLVGFRERASGKVADLERCEVLHPSVGAHIGGLARLIQTMDARERIPQLEVAVTDEIRAIVVRHLDPLSEADRRRLEGFAHDHGVHIYLQSGGPDSITPLRGTDPLDLHYTLPEYGLTLEFGVTGFTQVNFQLNQAMVHQALEWLAPASDEQVLDLFCGIGNFTLPLARQGARVVGVEGDQGLVGRARANARRNNIDNVEFLPADLMSQGTSDGSELDLTGEGWASRSYDKVLIDPPRSGALALMPLMGAMQPARIVYVACNPDTLARDVEVLVRGHGYRLLKAGIIDMFPHTAHVESMACLER